MIVKASSGHRFSLGIINIRAAGLFYSSSCEKRRAKLRASSSKACSFPWPEPRALTHVGEVFAPVCMEIHITH